MHITADFLAATRIVDTADILTWSLGQSLTGDKISFPAENFITKWC